MSFLSSPCEVFQHLLVVWYPLALFDTHARLAPFCSHTLIVQPAMLSADLLERDIELRDNTINVSFRGRTTHDLVLGAAAAGTRLALVDAEIRVLSYSWCVETRRITCRWQIVGTPRVPLTRVYHDRVSFFDVNDRGRIWRHTIDRITPSASQRRAPSLRDLLFPWQVADCRASVAAVAAHI